MIDHVQELLKTATPEAAEGIRALIANDICPLCFVPAGLHTSTCLVQIEKDGGKWYEHNESR